MKVIPKAPLVRFPKRLPILNQELMISFSVHHENIVQFKEWFQDRNFVYIVMELCRGGSLMSILFEPGMVLESTIRKYPLEVANGLMYLNHQRILHRDLKLENLLLCEDGVVKMTDFGFSMYIPDSAKVYSSAGSMHYTPPEVWESRLFSYPVDMFAFGVTLYTLLFKKYPFSGASIREVGNSIVQGDFQIPLTGGYSSPVLRLIASMLDKDPNSRLTIEEFYTSAWLGGSGALNEHAKKTPR